MKAMTMMLALALGWGLPLTAAEKAAEKKPAAAKAAASDSKAVEAAMKKAGCFTCHQTKRKVVGPSYLEIAKKYKGDKKAVETLVSKVKKGGSGVWGKVPMTPHPKLKEEEIEPMVRWVLAQK
jgi:cytochrome c